MLRILCTLLTIGLLCSCQKEELPDAEPVAIIDEKVTLNVHAKSLSSSGVLNPLLGNTITLYLSAEDRLNEDNIYFQATTNTAGTASFSSVETGDHIFLESVTSLGNRKVDDFVIGSAIIKNVEILH